MTALAFTILGARSERFAAQPTLAFQLRVAEGTGVDVHAILLRCQILIDPRRRRHARAEMERLVELFGEPHRWKDTVRPVLWTHVSVIVPAFRECLETALSVPCSYDLDVAGAKYFHALEDGPIPLTFQFSGTVFLKRGTGFSIEQIAWTQEASFELPVSVWREMMDAYFPGSGWIRLGREGLDALHRYRGTHALPSWDDAIASLLAQAGEPVRT